jgi:hypothetical protein
VRIKKRDMERGREKERGEEGMKQQADDGGGEKDLQCRLSPSHDPSLKRSRRGKNTLDTVIGTW